MDRTKRLLLLVTASCLMGQGSRLAFSQAPAEQPALAARVQAKLKGVSRNGALSASDLLGQPDFASQDIAEIQKALDYWKGTGFLRQTGEGKYFDQETVSD